MLLSYFLAISRRKLDMPIDEVIIAINSLDLKKLSLENVEMLQKMVPTDVEVKAYKEYIAERKDQSLLTEEDKFMLQLSKLERVSTRLSIMNYMGNYFDCLHLISPVRAVRRLIKNSFLTNFSYTANTSHLRRCQLAEAVHQIQGCAGDCASLWQLFEQQQTWSCLWL